MGALVVGVLGFSLCLHRNAVLVAYIRIAYCGVEGVYGICHLSNPKP